jgi:putative glycosyltransferase (TIGR04372 family)
MRRSKSLYNSDADYYFDAIDTIYSAGFTVSIIGDRKYFLEIAKEWNYPASLKTNNSDLSEYDQKAFELLAIENCKFVIGDQGGVWSLVKAFNKPGLMINTCPNSQLQSNVESLPKKWVYKATGHELLDANIIFNELFFKWTQESKIVKPFQEQVMNSADIEIPDYVTSEQNTNDIIIKVLKRYKENSVYLAPKKMQSIIMKNFQENIFLQIAENASYSEEYISKLTGWKIV